MGGNPYASLKAMAAEPKISFDEAWKYTVNLNLVS